MPLMTIGAGRTLFRAPTVVSAATTIAQWTLTTNDTAWEDDTLRQVVPITVGAGGGGQIRVTFEASGANTWKVDNASIGISTLANAAAATGAGTDSETTATPIELLFDGGLNGFTLTAGQTKTSDWASLSGFTSTQLLVIVQDVSATGGNSREITGLGIISSGGAGYYWTANSNSYNSATGAGTGFSGRVIGINKIEVQ